MLTRPVTPELVAIASLTRRPELQPRVQMNEALVEEYREAMQGGAEFPPIDAIELPDGERLLGDGWHRCGAAERAGRTEFLTYVWRGTYDDAIEFIAKRNARHGERRTMGDVVKAIKILRSLAKWQNASNVEIAKQIGVSEATVRRARSQTAVAGQPILDSVEGGANPIENTHPVSGRERRIVHRGGQEYSITLPPKAESPEPPEALIARLKGKAQAHTEKQTKENRDYDCKVMRKAFKRRNALDQSEFLMWLAPTLNPEQWTLLCEARAAFEEHERRRAVEG